MRRIGLVLLAAAMVAGTAGCGGWWDDEGQCPAYFCDSLCDKAVDCGFLPASEVTSCVPTCTAMAAGKNDIECGTFYSPATGMSCDELATFLGYRSALDIAGTSGHFLR